MTKYQCGLFQTKQLGGASSGTFDYLTNIVTLPAHDKDLKSFIETSLSDSSLGSSGNDAGAKNARKIRSLVIHEMTHFLDWTTTEWGLEFLYRKLLVLDAIDNSDSYECEDRVKVLHLNMAELKATHSRFHCHADDCDLSTVEQIKHCYDYDECLGTVLSVCLIDGKNEIISKVPITMHSMIEASGYSNEILSQILDIEGIKDVVARETASFELQEEVQKTIFDPLFNEYTILLFVVNIHFPGMTLKQKLVFISCLARFCLDLTGVHLSLISNFIQHTIENKVFRESVCNDLRRGMSRHLVFFKTVIFLHESLIGDSLDGIDGCINELNNDPMGCISDFWEAKLNCNASYWALYRLEHETSRSLVEELSGLLNHDSFLSSLDRNKSSASKGPMSLVGLKEFILPDFLLGDDTVISMPNRIDLDILKYCDDNLDLILELERLSVKELKDQEKFHMPLFGVFS